MIRWETCGRRLVGILSLVAVVIMGPEAHGSGLDVDDWLRQPGTRLLAIEFYATWCKPCMDAVPRWKALHDKYQADGLRFVVVATQDPDGSCSNPGWTPDAIICDDDGFLAQRFGVRKLPAAYLWSWQGRLLATHTHIDDIESKIQAWMRRSPRVEVEVGRVAKRAGIDRGDLLRSVRGELLGAEKLVVVATKAERRALRDIVRRSLQNTADDALACEVGNEITANSLLKASVTGGGKPRLQLRLLSAERGVSRRLDQHSVAPPQSSGKHPRSRLQAGQSAEAVARAVPMVNQ